MDDVVNQSKPKTTQRATDWGKKKFDEWCSRRGKIIDLVNIEADDLNIVLRKFYAEVKSKDGKVLSPSSLTGIRAAIHRLLTSPPLNRSLNIITDKEFFTLVVLSRLIRCLQVSVIFL